MMISQRIWTQLSDRLTNVFQELAEQVKQSIPELTIMSGRSDNAVFPFRAYATYAVTGDRMPVDVSVDCKLVGEQLIIRVDVAKENGLVLSEFSDQQVAVHTVSAEAEAVRIFSEIEAYLRNQVELIRGELA